MNNIELLNAIKNDMGLEGMGISAGKKRVYKKSGKARKPRATKNDVDLEGAGFKDFIKKAFNVVTLPIKLATLPLKMIGGAKHKRVFKHLGIEGSGQGMDFLKMLFNVFKNLKNQVGNDINLSDEAILNRTNRYASGLSAGGLSAGGLTAGGLTAGGLSAGKRKYIKKNKTGDGIVGDIFKGVQEIANFSPLSNVTKNSPLSKMLGDENVKKIVSDIVIKKMGGKRGRPKGAKNKKQGAKKGLSERSKIVKQVMKDEGLSMIEASKYVKDNNLY